MPEGGDCTGLVCTGDGAGGCRWFGLVCDIQSRAANDRARTKRSTTSCRLQDAVKSAHASNERLLSRASAPILQKGHMTDRTATTRST